MPSSSPKRSTARKQFVKCPEGWHRNPQTNRCKKNKTKTTTRKRKTAAAGSPRSPSPSPPPGYRSPTPPPGYRSPSPSPPPGYRSPTPPRRQTPSPPSQRRSPPRLTTRKKFVRCEEGWHRNPITNRCKNGRPVVVASSRSKDPSRRLACWRCKTSTAKRAKNIRLSPALRAEVKRRKPSLLQRFDWEGEELSPGALKRRIGAAILAERGYSKSPSPYRTPPRTAPRTPPKPRVKPKTLLEEDLTVDELLDLMETPEKTPEINWSASKSKSVSSKSSKRGVPSALRAY